jgi:hypothetical protein
LLVACSGTAYAAATVRSGDIVDGTIRSVDVKDGTIARRDLTPGPWRAVSAWRTTDGEYCANAAVVARFCGETAEGGSWVNYDKGWQTARFRKDATGEVSLEGLVQANSPYVSGDIFRLPAGFRPAAFQLFPIACGTGSSPHYDTTGLVQVETNGMVTYRYYDECQIGSYLSLSGIRFQAP